MSLIFNDLLHQFVDWFEELVGSQGIMFAVRSTELETRLLSSNDPIKAEVDTVAFS